MCSSNHRTTRITCSPASEGCSASPAARSLAKLGSEPELLHNASQTRALRSRESGQKALGLRFGEVDGGSPAQKLFDAPGITIQSVVAPDGRSVLYVGSTNNRWHIFRVALDSPSVARQFVENETATFPPAFSPDGKWVMITSPDESGRPDVFVRSYPDPAVRLQVSATGGVNDMWSADGNRVYYDLGDGGVLSATLATEPPAK